MSEQKINDFKGAIFGLALIFNDNMSMEKFQMYFEILKKYNIEKIKKACSLLASRNKFMPKPAEIIELIEVDKTISADEAWALALQASDENNTVVWSSIAMNAWFNAALPIFEMGDKIGARRAFIDAYDRLMNLAVMNNQPIEMVISQGFDKEKRKDPIEKALKMGLITEQQANHYLPKPEPTFEMLENHMSKRGSSDRALEHLAALKKLIKRAS